MTREVDQTKKTSDAAPKCNRDQQYNIDHKANVAIL